MATYDKAMNQDQLYNFGNLSPPDYGSRSQAPGGYVPHDEAQMFGQSPEVQRAYQQERQRYLDMLIEQIIKENGGPGRLK